MGRRIVNLTSTLAAAILGLALNAVLLADNSSENLKRSPANQYHQAESSVQNDYAAVDKREADYRHAKENCKTLTSAERGACRAEAKAEFVAIIEQGTGAHTYALYTEKLRIFPDFLLIRSRFR